MLSAVRLALGEQPGYEKNGAGGKPAGNRRNGKPSKTLLAVRSMADGDCGSRAV
ncbi:MAG: hypothetical protein LBH43_11335 [Treponema sp.]|nr:hypothetical protein [Treponema sp.]